MGERKFRENLQEKLAEELRNYEVRICNFKNVKVNKDENLIYKVIVNIVNGNLKFEPSNPRRPRRGNYAFQTDLLISGIISNNSENKDISLPLVAIEVKYKNKKKKYESVTTHNILTYSTKAQKHKEVYPYLRYGLVIGGMNKIPKRFFTHNIGFDFAYALNSIDDSNSVKDLANIVKQQVKSACLLLNILQGSQVNQVKKFNTIIEIR